MKQSIFQKLFASIGLLGIVLLLAGCPYSSTVPIDEGTIPVPKKLEGKWVKVSDKDSENPTYYEITKEENSKAIALKYEFSSSDSIYESTKYHLTFSDVSGEIFMNVMEDGGSSYYLYKFSLDETTTELTTYEVTDYIKETFSSSEELKSFISKNKAMSYFFTNTIDSYVKM